MLFAVLAIKARKYIWRYFLMKKILLLTVLLILTLVVPCAAESKEIIAEGTYIANENDSPAQGEEAALLIAKRVALEQSGTLVQSESTVDMLQLKSDQIKSISSAVMETTVLDKSRTFDGKSMVFWVKIKAIVYPDKVIESIKNGAFEKKKVVGVITLHDVAKPTFSSRYPGPIDFDKTIDTLKTSLTEKYGIRNSEIEIGLPVQKKLSDYMQSNNVTADSLTDNVILDFAIKNKYDYIIFSSTKWTNYTSGLNIWADSCSIENILSCDFKILDTNKLKTIYQSTIIGKGKEKYTLDGQVANGKGFYSQIAANNAMHDIIDQINKNAPDL